MQSWSEDPYISGEGADDNVSHCMLLGFGSYE